MHISCNALYFKAFIKCLMCFALYSYKMQDKMHLKSLDNQDK